MVGKRLSCLSLIDCIVEFSYSSNVREKVALETYYMVFCLILKAFWHNGRVRFKAQTSHANSCYYIPKCARGSALY